MSFPKGRKIGLNARRGSPSELYAWERANGIELPSLEGMPDVRQVAKRYGVSVPTIWRWCQKSGNQGTAA
jgi:predicted DNA-binding transcriptional regulator AlpA